MAQIPEGTPGKSILLPGRIEVSVAESPASSREGVRYASLIDSVWATLQIWLLVREGPLLEQVFITK